MKSRGTILLLLVAVAGVWGAVAWRIFAPTHPDTSVVLRAPEVHPQTKPGADTLRLGYPDPFLKSAPHNGSASRILVRRLPLPKAVPSPRERIEIIYLGTVASSVRTFHILAIGGEQYELASGEAARGFVLVDCDCDSLYLRKAGVTYGVKRCEQP